LLKQTLQSVQSYLAEAEEALLVDQVRSPICYFLPSVQMQKKIDRKSPPAWATERALMPGDLLILHRYLFLQAYLASLCELQNERRKLRDILDSTKSTSQRFGLEGDEYDALFNHYRHERMSCL